MFISHREALWGTKTFGLITADISRKLLPPQRESIFSMNALSESNVRNRSHGLALILIAVTAVWAMPRNACAQLYIAQQGAGERSGVVREYDAATGDAINANFITGLNYPFGLAVKDSK